MCAYLIVFFFFTISFILCLINHLIYYVLLSLSLLVTIHQPELQVLPTDSSP